jgi:hypothetical protein
VWIAGPKSEFVLTPRKVSHGEGFRMPSGVRKPPKHEPAGLR